MSKTVPTTDRPILGSEHIARALEAEGLHDAAVIHRMRVDIARELLAHYQYHHPDEFAERLRELEQVHAQAEARDERRLAGAR